MHIISSKTTLLVFSLIIVQVFGQNGIETVSTPISTTTTTLFPSTTKEVATTILKASSTTDPSTTTEMPSSTSQSTEVNKKTTTTSLTTHTTPKPITPPTPPESPTFPENVGTWNNSCIMIKGALQLTFSTVQIAVTDVQTINVPVGAGVTGSCSTPTQSLKLEWFTPDKKWRHGLQFTFTQNISDSTYAISEIKFSYATKTNNSATNSENASNGTVLVKGSFYPTHFNHSYLCTLKQMIDGDLKVQTAEFQFEAFRPKGDQKSSFSDPELCKADTTHAVTVIGIVLGSLLFVLAAVSVGIFIGVRYGYFSLPCCKRASGYQRLDVG